MTGRPVALAVLCAALVAATGCGENTGNAGSGRGAAAHSGPVQELQVTAAPSGALSFVPSTLDARPGRVRLVVRNPGSTGEQHGIAIEGEGVDVSGPVVGPGAASAVAATLTRGTYRYLCPFDHHAQRGMRGTLRIR